MKNILLFIFLALIISPLNSCKKEDIEVNPEKNYRLKEFIDIFTEGNDVLGDKIVFHYNNQDQLSKMEYFDSENSTDWELSGKLEIAYNSQTTTMTYYTFENSQWAEFYTKTLTYSGIELTNYKVTNSLSETYYEVSYQYTNGLLSSYTKTYYNPSSSTTTATYSYTNGVLSEENTEDNSGNLYKTEFLYENDRIKTKLYWDFDEVWNQDHKSEYVYANDLLTSYTFFWLNPTDQWVQEEQLIFNYDENNTLQTVSTTWGSEITMTTEEGNSNLEDFILPEDKLHFYPTNLSFIESHLELQI